MREIYFPSCNFTKASPRAARAIRAYLAQRMPVAGCCRVDPQEYPEGASALYFCQACRETLEQRAQGKLTPRNIFEYLLEDAAFPWPDHSGLTVTVQDCWRDRDHPEIFAAVRSALSRMNVRIVEMEENREHSVFCGNLHFEPSKEENRALLEEHGDAPLFTLPEEFQRKLMREQVEKYPCETVVTYCNRCKAGVELGGGKAMHLMELVTAEL